MIVSLLASVTVGFAAGCLLPDGPRVRRLLAAATTGLVWTVVWAQGIVLGGTQRPDWGLLVLIGHAFVLAAAVLLPSVAVAEWIGRVAGGPRGTPAELGDNARAALPWVGLVTLPALLASGMVLAWTLPSLGATLAPWTGWPLLALLFVAGLDLGRGRHDLIGHLRRGGVALVVAPAVLVASILGGLVASLVLPYPAAALGAGGAGVGFYSVTGPMIATMESAQAGGVVFLANLLREMGGMTLIPFLPRVRLGPEAGSAIGGATTMDSTLPFMLRTFGSRGVAVGLPVGVALSLAVPPAVPLVHRALQAIFTS